MQANAQSATTYFCANSSVHISFPVLRYRIYLINHPGYLLNFGTLRMSVYWRWALIRSWVRIKIFTIFSNSSMFILQQTINGNNKTRRCNKARLMLNTLKKTPSSGKSFISTRSISISLSLKCSQWVNSLVLPPWCLTSGEWGGGGSLFEAGHLLTFSAFGMGANSKLGTYSNIYGVLCLRENYMYFYQLLNCKYNITPGKTTYMYFMLWNG